MILSIREADKGDVEQMSRVVCETWKDAFADLVTKSDMDNFADFVHQQNRFEQRLKDREFVYVLLCDGQVSAVCTASFCRDRDLFDACMIDQLYVLPEFQRKGFGRKLLFYTLRSMRGKGFKQAALYVMDGNGKAVSFYKKFGFRADGKTEKCRDYENNNLLMRYTISL